MTFLADGRLAVCVYEGSDAGVAIYDLGADTRLDFFLGTGCYGMDVTADGEELYFFTIAGGPPSVFGIDLTTNTEMDLDGDLTDGVNGGIFSERLSSGHTFILTPF
jgi:hypothetical protein